MSYIGQQLPADVFSGYVTDTFTGDGSATTFTLSKAPFSADSLIVVVDNVIQQPTVNFTVSGTTLTIVGTAILSGIKGYAIHTGGTLPITTASGLASNILTQQTDIGANIADADLFLVDDGAGGTLRKTAASRLKTYIGSVGGDTGLDVNDSVKIRLGTGNDTELYFDGSDTIFDHTPGSGGFYIRGDNVTIQDSQSTPNQFVRMDQGSGVTFNDGSLDHDFRVETNGEAYALFVDGGNDVVMFGGTGSGSGTSTPRSVMYASGHIYQFVATDSTTDIQRFYNADTGSEIGSIEGQASATAFRTSSDYRLKENVDYDWDATTRLKQLKPARFNWIIDDTNTPVDGFLAHEVSSVVPEAVGGEKDAVDDDGKIIPQGIDQSKLVPLMVKTIQELEARIKTLEDA